MRDYVIWSGVALCLFALWAIGRHDWVRLTRPRCTVTARVVGHRKVADSGGDGASYAARLAFAVAGQAHEVTDQLAHSQRKLDVGDVVELAYPEGRPDLARPPRPLLWALVYLLLAGLAAMLAAEGLWPGFWPRS